jgi:hypothetical protein
VKSLRYVRFVVAELDWQSGRRSGLIHAAEVMEYVFSDEELSHYRLISAWFNDNLPVPDRLSKSSKSHPKNVALSWFKDGSGECIARMRELAVILEAHDVRTEMLWTERPGYIVYEDEFQVAAEPFSDTPT